MEKNGPLLQALVIFIYYFYYFYFSVIFMYFTTMHNFFEVFSGIFSRVVKLINN